MATNFKCSMTKKKESLSKKNEDVLGTIDHYTIMDVYQNGKDSNNPYANKSLTSADELYKALDSITGGNTKGNVSLMKASPESTLEGYLELFYEKDGADWAFRVWFMLAYTDPVPTALKDLGLDA